MTLMQKISKNERCDFICLWINFLGNVFLKLSSLTGGLLVAFYFSVAAGQQHLNLYRLPVQHAKAHTPQPYLSDRLGAR